MHNSQLFLAVCLFFCNFAAELINSNGNPIYA